MEAKRLEELMRLLNDDARSQAEHDKAYKRIFGDMASYNDRPKIERDEGNFVFKDKTGAIVAKMAEYGPETLRSLELSYLAFQVAYEDAKSIDEGTYLKWSRHLKQRGLVLSAEDNARVMALDDRFKGFKTA